MRNLSVKLFRRHDEGLKTPAQQLPFVGDVIAVVWDSRERGLMSLVESVTKQGADQVTVTPTMFTELLRASRRRQAEVMSLELSGYPTAEHRELIDAVLEGLKYHAGIGEDDWSQALDLVYAYPPVKAEVLVGDDGPGERFVVLSNGVIHCSDGDSLSELGKVLEPAIW